MVGCTALSGALRWAEALSWAGAPRRADGLRWVGALRWAGAPYLERMSGGLNSVELAARYRRWPGGDAPSGRLCTENILAEGWGPGASLGSAVEQAGPLVVWSGWLGDEASSRTGEVEADFRNWSGAGRRRLDEVVAGLLGAEGRGGAGTLWLRPHFRHVLSDGPSCAAFLRAREGLVVAGRLGLLLDVDLLIAPEMEARREDHVLRLVASAAAMGVGVGALAMGRDDWEGEAGRLAGGLSAGMVRLEGLRN